MLPGNPSPHGARAHLDRTAFERLKRHGTDAVSFQSVKDGLEWWHDAPPPGGSGGSVAYLPAGRSWIAVGAPLADAAYRAEAVRRFSRAARRCAASSGQCFALRR